MSEQQNEKTFEPITTQEEFDERIKGRLAREREKWEKESGTEELQEEISALKREQHQEKAQQALTEHLAGIGVRDEGRQSRILKHVDLDELDPEDSLSVVQSLEGVRRDLPELLTERVSGAGSGGSSKPVPQGDPPLTRKEIEGMSAEEMDGAWERVEKFLQGNR